MKDTKLNKKQIAFINEFCIDKNGTQAAIRAGYSENCAKEQASRLLTNANINQEINKRLTELAKKCEISAEWVLESLKEIYSKAMQKEPVLDREGRIVEYRFDGNVANRSVELIAKHLGMFIERTENKTTLEILGIQNDSDLVRAAQEIIDEARTGHTDRSSIESS